MENTKLTKDFYLHEFNDEEPELDLLIILQELRFIVDSPVTINKDEGTKRDILQHINIYKDIYGDKWFENIPWGSRHLPKYNSKLRAVDFSVKGYTGKQIASIVNKIATKWGIHIGVGIGKSFIHLDVDREKYTEWTYNR